MQVLLKDPFKREWEGPEEGEIYGGIITPITRSLPRTIDLYHTVKLPFTAYL